MGMLKEPRFWYGVIAGVLIVKFVAPRLTGVPVIGGVAGAVS